MPIDFDPTCDNAREAHEHPDPRKCRVLGFYWYVEESDEHIHQGGPCHRRDDRKRHLTFQALNVDTLVLARVLVRLLIHLSNGLHRSGE